MTENSIVGAGGNGNHTVCAEQFALTDLTGAGVSIILKQRAKLKAQMKIRPNCPFKMIKIKFVFTLFLIGWNHLHDLLFPF